MNCETKSFIYYMYAILLLLMTDYHLKPGILPSLATSEAKEKRRKVLEEVRKRRKIIYQKFKAKRAKLVKKAFQ